MSVRAHLFGGHRPGLTAYDDVLLSTTTDWPQPNSRREAATFAEGEPAQSSSNPRIRLGPVIDQFSMFMVSP